MVKLSSSYSLEDSGVALFVDVEWQLLLVAQEVVDVLGLRKELLVSQLLPIFLVFRPLLPDP